MIAYVLIALSIVLFVFGIRIIRPTHVGLIETLGKYSKTAGSGFYWIIPLIQRMYYVNMTEQMVDTNKQMVITKDNLNASVDAIVYYKVVDPKSSQYNVDNHRYQLVALAQTTLRAVVGNMTFTSANENRTKLNEEVEKVLDKETKTYGVDVLRVEIQRIEAPNDVQNAMNEVVKAERLRIASTEQANAVEIEADGARRASIKQADGSKQAEILIAEGRAKAIELVNTSAQKFFKGNAVELERLKTTQVSLKDNSKIIITKDGINPQLLVGQIPTIDGVSNVQK
jgi:regulator of protease activity HflC (stomatin/prohibitin superfamily)